MGRTSGLEDTRGFREGNDRSSESGSANEDVTKIMRSRAIGPGNEWITDKRGMYGVLRIRTVKHMMGAWLISANKLTNRGQNNSETGDRLRVTQRLYTTRMEIGRQPPFLVFLPDRKHLPIPSTLLNWEWAEEKFHTDATSRNTFRTQGSAPSGPLYPPLPCTLSILLLGPTSYFSAGFSYARKGWVDLPSGGEYLNQE